MHDARPASPNCCSSIAARIARSASAAIARDDDALARGETVRLDDDGKAELAGRDHGVERWRRRTDAIARRRNAVARHEVLRERPCCTRAARRRATDRRCAARGVKAIDDAAIERQLGTDDREIDALALGEREQRIGIAGIDGGQTWRRATCRDCPARR